MAPEEVDKKLKMAEVGEANEPAPEVEIGAEEAAEIVNNQADRIVGESQQLAQKFVSDTGTMIEAAAKQGDGQLTAEEQSEAAALNAKAMSLAENLRAKAATAVEQRGAAGGEKIETGKKQSQRVFENIYNQLKQPRTGVTTEKHGANFIAELATGAEHHIDPIEQAGMTNKQIFDEIWGKMSQYLGEYAAKHNGNQARVDKRKQEVEGVYRKLTDHVNKLVKDGKASPLTAKVFLRSVPGLKFIGDYNAVTRSNENIAPETLRAQNTTYAETVEQIWSEQPQDTKEEQQTGGFYHFNTKVEGKVKNRIYVSARLSGSPDQVVKAWDDALKETGLRDKIYFKLPTGLMKRFETVIIYQTDKTSDSDVEKALTAFVAKIPDTLLSDKDMPTGVPLRRGISTAPEPDNINTFLQYTGSENNISYNQLVTSLSELSFELAYKESVKSGAASQTPKSLKDSAAKYFDQMIALAGINPDTMVPNAQGGKQPAWAERVASLS